MCSSRTCISSRWCCASCTSPPSPHHSPAVSHHWRNCWGLRAICLCSAAMPEGRGERLAGGANNADRQGMAVSAYPGSTLPLLSGPPLDYWEAGTPDLSGNEFRRRWISVSYCTLLTLYWTCARKRRLCDGFTGIQPCDVLGIRLSERRIGPLTEPLALQPVVERGAPRRLKTSGPRRRPWPADGQGEVGGDTGRCRRKIGS